jgi:hypothetical protein
MRRSTLTILARSQLQPAMQPRRERQHLVGSSQNDLLRLVGSVSGYAPSEENCFGIGRHAGHIVSLDDSRRRNL